MEKVQVINVSPVGCMSRPSLPPSPMSMHLPSLLHHEPNTDHFSNLEGQTPSKTAQISSLRLSNVNNNPDFSCLSRDPNTLNNNISRKKFSNHNREQGTVGFVNERIRALSVSNRSGHRFGSPELRASYNERLHSGPASLQMISRNGSLGIPEASNGLAYQRLAAMKNGVYRSNSSLDLDPEGETEHRLVTETSPLRREYGSHGSINVSAVPPDSLFAILREGHPVMSVPCESSVSATAADVEPTSPKVKSKFPRLWGGDKDKSSIFKKLRSSKSADGKCDSRTDVSSESGITAALNNNATLRSVDTSDTDSRGEETVAVRPPRRSAFAHYDCRSLAAQLSSVHYRTLLNDRGNTTTGASAASMAAVTVSANLPKSESSEDLQCDDLDPGDGKSSSLISSCPYFRNELGGEGERVVTLSRDWLGVPATTNTPKCSGTGPGCGQSGSISLHRSVTATTLGLLEHVSTQSHWRQMCPYVKCPFTVEAVDQGANYYRDYFHAQEHQNWFGVDENLGPVAISIKREKIDEVTDSAHSLAAFQFRVIIRTSDLFTTKGTLLEECLGRNVGDKSSSRSPGIREVLEYTCPRLTVGCLRQGQNTPATEDALLRLDDLGVHKKFKVGVLYCRGGQSTEEEMYNNEIAGPAFSEFLEMLGQRVRLKDFEKYRGGLDKKTDSTGLYSVYAGYQDCEVMFHVSTLLPYTANNRKQLLRKRHIGNDIVTIVFQEPGAPPFSPRFVRSHFQHVFVVVRVINPCSDNTQYSVAVSRFRDMPMFGPAMPEGSTFQKSKAFAEFLLAKVINGEIASLRSEKFASMATRTRHEYLKDLCVNHSTSLTLDTSSKFSLMSFSRSGKKEKKIVVKFVPEVTVRGGVSWPVLVHDASSQQNVECVLSVSVDSVVVLEESSASVIFATPCKGVIGWTTRQQQALRLFYHQGECLLINIRPGTLESEGEEIVNEIVVRLSCVTHGSETQELVLKRNASGLLGFNVQQDGIITEVEPYGLAAQSGLRQGSRLVEICTIALATLTQEQMVDLLKTSMTVTVTIVPPHADGSPRKGCNIPTCGFLLGGSEGDYENLNTPEEFTKKQSRSKHHRNTNRYDGSVSPPRSISSSGYGTGNSSKSYPGEHQRPTSEIHQELPKVHSAPEGFLDRLEYVIPPTHMGDYDHNSEYTSSDPRWCHSGEPVAEDAPHSLSHRSPHMMLQSRSVDSPPPPLPARVAGMNTSRRGSDSYQFYVPRSSGSAYAPQLSTIPSSPFSPPSGSVTLTPFRAPPPFSSRHPDYDSMGDHGNYAVPPPNPRPLNSAGDSTEYRDWCDYNNAVHKPSVDLQKTTKQSDELKLVEYLSWRGDRGVSRTCSLPVTPGQPPCQGEGVTEGLLPCRSEDELSASSGGSPHSRRRLLGGNSTPSSTSSRNQSPRTVSSDATRLRSSAVSRRTTNRNSANLGSSSLQEDLFRLINPDLISDMPDTRPTHHNGVDESSRDNKTSLSSQDDAVTVATAGPQVVNIVHRTGIHVPATTTTGMLLSSDISETSNIPRAVQECQTEEVILLTARPATVISNSSVTSSPAPPPYTGTEGGFGVAKSNSVLKDADQHTLHTGPITNSSPVGDDGPAAILDQEWTSLVHTATQAIQKRTETAFSGQSQTNSAKTDWTPASAVLPGTVNDEAEPAALRQQVTQLQKALIAEQHHREQLQEEVSQLRLDNRKLQEDSRAAAQQLHQFTEWFFNTIDKT